MSTILLDIKFDVEMWKLWCTTQERIQDAVKSGSAAYPHISVFDAATRRRFNVRIEIWSDSVIIEYMHFKKNITLDDLFLWLSRRYVPM